MSTVTPRDFLVISFPPNLLLLVFLVWQWGTGKIHFPPLQWSAGFRVLGYVLVLMIIYFGVLSWMSRLLVAVATKAAWLLSLIRGPQTQRATIFLVVLYAAILLIDALLGVPFAMTRASRIRSFIFELGYAGNLLGLTATVLSVYGLLWNVTGRSGTERSTL